MTWFIYIIIYEKISLIAGTYIGQKIRLWFDKLGSTKMYSIKIIPVEFSNEFSKHTFFNVFLIEFCSAVERQNLMGSAIIITKTSIRASLFSYRRLLPFLFSTEPVLEKLLTKLITYLWTYIMVWISLIEKLCHSCAPFLNSPIIKMISINFWRVQTRY